VPEYVQLKSAEVKSITLDIVEQPMQRILTQNINDMNNLKVIITALILAITGTAAMAQDPADIIRRMEDNMRGDASYTEMTMEVVRPRYTREISMRSWTLGDDFALINITAPARDEGTGFLKRGNDIWNYVPNIDRTIKMPPSMMSQSWMGSDFTNDDLVQGTSRVDDFPMNSGERKRLTEGNVMLLK
jgi:hypothetical protein